MASEGSFLARPALWRGIFFLSLAYFIACDWSKLPLRLGSDGDTAYYFYVNGLTSWPAMLGHLVLRPDDPPFLLGHWRPTVQVFSKLLWELRASPLGIAVANWLATWLACLAFGFGFRRVLAPAAALSEAFPWMVASLLFLSGPMAFTASVPISYMGNAMVVAFFGLAAGAAMDLGVGPRRKWRTLGAAALALLALHSHEVSWFLFVWFGAWLFFLKREKLSNARVAPYWWPWAILVAYILYFRTLVPDPNSWLIRKIQPGKVTDIVAAHVPYFFMAIFNGLSWPLADWAKPLLAAINEGYDVITDAPPFDFLLTAGAIGCAAYAWRRSGAKSKAGKATRGKRVWKLATLSLAATALACTVPFWFMHAYRFVYLLSIPAAFLAVWIAVTPGADKRLSAVPAILLLAANGIATYRYLVGWNFTELNYNYTGQFAQALLKRPELGDCASAHPCCLSFKQGSVAVSAWTLNWYVGVPRQPAFFPTDWPAANCNKTYEF